MAYSDNFPATRPVFQADFANGGRIDPRATFTRSDTPPTYAAPSAVHYWSNEKHLSSENLILQSQSYDTTWTTNRLASSGGLTGSQSAPDGTTTAWLVTADTHASASPFLNQDLSGITNSTEYTASAYLKAGTASHGYISLRGQYGHIAWAEIDFASPLSPASGGANFTSISATSTAVGSTGWYRLTLTCTTSTVTAASTKVGPSDGTDPSLYGYATWNCSGETIYVWGHQLEQRGSATAYNPTTTQIHREYAPTLKSVDTAGQPRFEYDPASDGQSVAKGILIEGQSTNLLGNSADFGGSWQILNATKSIEAIGPDGTLSAIAFREGTNSNEKRLFSYFNNGGGNVTFSVYAKILGNARRLVIREAIYTGLSAVFDLATGTKVSGNGSIESVGNGWYRCQLNFSSSQPTPGVGFYIIPADGESYTASAFAGDGYSGLLLTMPQAENQSFASSYINTGIGGGTATRAAESLSMTDSSLFDTGSGSLVVEAVVKSLNDGVAAWLGTDGNNYHQVGAFGSTTYPLISKADGVVSAVLSSSAVSTGAAHKVGASWDTNDFAACVDGGAVVTDTSGTLPAVNKLTVGNYNAVAAWLDGHVKRVAVYNEALSDTNLQALTS